MNYMFLPAADEGLRMASFRNRDFLDANLLEQACLFKQNDMIKLLAAKKPELMDVAWYYSNGYVSPLYKHLITPEADEQEEERRITCLYTLTFAGAPLYAKGGMGGYNSPLFDLAARHETRTIVPIIQALSDRNNSMKEELVNLGFSRDTLGLVMIFLDAYRPFEMLEDRTGYNLLARSIVVSPHVAVDLRLFQLLLNNGCRKHLKLKYISPNCESVEPQEYTNVYQLARRCFAVQGSYNSLNPAAAAFFVQHEEQTRKGICAPKV